MIDILVGIVLLFLGVIWLVYEIKTQVKWDAENDPMGWSMNFKGFAGSITTILLGIAFIFGVFKLDMLF